MNYVESFNLFGVEATQIPCAKGDGAPTTATEGAVGCLYMDTSSESKDLYKCTAVVDGVYTWMSLLAEGAGATPMVVSEDADDNQYASFSYDEIANHATSGGFVYLEIDGNIVPLHHLDRFNEKAIFEYKFRGDDDHLYIERRAIDSNSMFGSDQTWLATAEDIGDISTALDSIIAIQNGLIGGDGA